jgi:hypothetical protein
MEADDLCSRQHKAKDHRVVMSGKGRIGDTSAACAVSVTPKQPLIECLDSLTCVMTRYHTIVKAELRIIKRVTRSEGTVVED